MSHVLIKSVTLKEIKMYFQMIKNDKQTQKKTESCHFVYIFITRTSTMFFHLLSNKIE